MDQMVDGHQWMIPDHSWSGVTHDFSDPLAHIWFITMYGAVLAGRFSKPKRAGIQSFIRIGPKLGTLLAKRIACVFLAAVQADHSL